VGREREREKRDSKPSRHVQYSCKIQTAERLIIGTIETKVQMLSSHSL